MPPSSSFPASLCTSPATGPQRLHHNAWCLVTLGSGVTLAARMAGYLRSLSPELGHYALGGERSEEGLWEYAPWEGGSGCVGEGWAIRTLTHSVPGPVAEGAADLLGVRLARAEALVVSVGVLPVSLPACCQYARL